MGSLKASRVAQSASLSGWLALVHGADRHAEGLTVAQVRAPGSARNKALIRCAAASGSEVAAIGWVHGHQ